MSLLGPLVEHVEGLPLDYMSWLPGQWQFLTDPSRRKLMRAGNQAQGKTTAGLADILTQARGDSRFRPAPVTPTDWWVVSSSEQQSGVLQEKLSRMVPARWLHPDTPWMDSKGAFKGKNPKIGIKHSRNGWSWLHFRWTGQHGLNLASASLTGGVWFDEPPTSRRAYTEVERRVTRTGGQVILTLTPVNAPVDYLAELCRAGRIVDHHFPLRPDLLIPVGDTEPICTGRGELMDSAWIEEQRQLVPGYEAPVVLDGEWETRQVDRVFERFDDTTMVIPNLLRSDILKRHGSLICSAGFDWGEEALRTSGILVAIDETDPDEPWVFVLGEYAPDTATVTEDDARATLSMLGSVGLQWHELDEAWGDKKYTDSAGRITKKSCEDMHRAIALRLRVPAESLLPVIGNAKKGPHAGRGARNQGIRVLHAAMVRRRFFVDASCIRLIQCLKRWRGGEMEEWKDPIDALRYSIRRLVLPEPSPLYVPGPVFMRRK